MKRATIHESNSEISSEEVESDVSEEYNIFGNEAKQT